MQEESKGQDPWTHRLSFFFKFIYLFLAVLDLRCCTDFSLGAVSGGSSICVHRLLVVVASLAAEQRL